MVAGMLFRAEAAFSPELTPETFPTTSTDSTINLPDFSLVNHYAQTHYLGSNSQPDLLANVPPQDLFTYSSALAAHWDVADMKNADAPAWDSLWHNVSRIPITAVPEPSTLALLAIGSGLLGLRKKNFGGR